MGKSYKRNKKSSKKLNKQSRNTRTRTKASKKRMTGGACFNQPINFSDIPPADFYKLNTYSNDVSRAPYLQDARLMSGGSCGCAKKYGGRLKRTFRKKARRLQKGGISFVGDGLLGNAPVGLVGNFGTSSGTNLNLSVLNTGTAAVPGSINQYDINTPPANMPAMV